MRDFSYLRCDRPTVTRPKSGDPRKCRCGCCQAADEITALRAEVERMREALEMLLVGACAVGVPHAGERLVLQQAVDAARAALKEQP
jgi:hypothetical protein